MRIKKDILIAVLLFLLAFGLRIYKIEEITPGMWGDEITVSSAGEELINTRKLAVYVSNNYGRPTPFLYFSGAVVKTFGRSITSVRLPAILFGALSVVAFYFLLRLYFRVLPSIAGSLVLSFSYPLLIISRLGYDITASFFFQILTLLAFSLFYKSGKLIYAVLLGFYLGMGLYTYYNFRLYALEIILLCAIFIYSHRGKIGGKIKTIAVGFLTFLLVALPLLVFAVKSPDVFLARINSLSVFGQNLSASEVVKEVAGATFRLSYLFVFTGDPNPRQNPSGVPMFDYFTTLTSLVGLIYLYRKEKTLFFVSLFVLFSSIANDIFSLERIPEFHYYGLGHPNTFRISGIVIVMCFWATAGFSFLFNYLSKTNKKLSIISVAVIAVVIMLINSQDYFNQASLNSKFYLYNYEYNGVRMLNVVDILNKSNAKKVSLSKSFADDDRIKYFLRKGIEVDVLAATNLTGVHEATKRYDITVFDPRENKDLAKSIVMKNKEVPNFFYLQQIVGPGGNIESFILNRNYSY